MNSFSFHILCTSLGRESLGRLINSFVNQLNESVDSIEPNESNNESDLFFQAFDWYSEDIINEETNYPEYKVFIFGILDSGLPISIRVDDFYPFFFIEVPTNWDKTCIYDVKNAFNNRSIKSFEFLTRHRYYGFENNKLRKFIKLSFYSNRALRYTRNQIESGKISHNGQSFIKDVYESNIDPILRLTHIRDLLTAGWIRIPKNKYSFDQENDFVTTSWTSLSNIQEKNNELANFRILYFDIEACSEDGSFPDATRLNDKVTQICCIIKDSKNNSSLNDKTLHINNNQSIEPLSEKYLFNLGTIDSIEDTTVIQCKSEKKLLLEYSQFIRDTNPDIIVGYNIFGFDNGFLFERAKVLNITDKFKEIKEKKLDNKQS